LTCKGSQKACPAEVRVNTQSKISIPRIEQVKWGPGPKPKHTGNPRGVKSCARTSLALQRYLKGQFQVEKNGEGRDEGTQSQRGRDVVSQELFGWKKILHSVTCGVWGGEGNDWEKKLPSLGTAAVGG